MRIVDVLNERWVKKTKKEYQRDLEKYENKMIVSDYKKVPIKEPIYVVEMSQKEIQLVSFYLELENRKPIMNVEIDTKVGKGELKWNLKR